MRHADAGYDRAVEVAARARACGSRCARALDGARDHDRRRPGAARSGAPELDRRASCARPEIQRLIDDLIETRRTAGGAGLAATAGVGARADRRRRGRRGHALPVQAADPADRDRQPDDRAAFRRAAGDQRGLPVRAGAARRRAAASTVRVRYLDRDGEPHEAVAARADRRHLPARGRPPRRSAVPRPGDGPGTFSTWEQFERHREADFLRRVAPYVRDAAA